VFLGKYDGKISLKRSRYIILKWIKNGVEECGLDSCGSELGPAEGSFGEGNELSGSIKCLKYLDYINGHLLLKTDSAPCS
jgi:hypothetical protein